MLHMSEYSIAAEMRSGRDYTFREKIDIVARLSTPGILAQISEFLMQYIDAAMVGALGAAASASIGLVASSTWLIGGTCIGLSTGFSVQVAQLTGARRPDDARDVSDDIDVNDDFPEKHLDDYYLYYYYHREKALANIKKSG